MALGEEKSSHRYTKKRWRTEKKVGFFPIIIQTINRYKQRLVSKLFWGRGNIYRNISHGIMISITAFALFSGVLIRISSVTSTQSSFTVDATTTGTNDVLQQGGSVSTVLQSSIDGLEIQTQTHVVQEGETFSEIASQYNVSKDTIRWATSDIPEIYFTEESLQTGWVLTIPEINGVLYTVRSGQSLDDIIEITSQENSEANRFNIIELNALTPPYDVTPGQQLFIPGGNLRRIGPEGSIDSIPRGIFIDPLADPACNGYTWSRGFLSYHNGVDLAKWDGCPISAVANGIVEYAGWGNGGQGYYVRINHGGGIKTEYFHGNGEIWVKPGERVLQGQHILQMGTTGNSTGTHVHFILWKNGVAVDPAPYVPYWRPY